jgi:hypothetical protein
LACLALVSCKNVSLGLDGVNPDGAAGGSGGKTADATGAGGTGGVDTGGTAGANPQPDAAITPSSSVNPSGAVDILFMVDNSPSMDPKQQALAANFPLMIQKLQQLPGGMPDIHIGVVSSDMGAGSEAAGVNCARVLGDRGLLWGNDPNNLTASIAPGSPAATADPNNPITNGCGLRSGARWIVDIANPDGTRNQNYRGNLTDVFSCLAISCNRSGLPSTPRTA